MPRFPVSRSVTPPERIPGQPLAARSLQSQHYFAFKSDSTPQDDRPTAEDTLKLLSALLQRQCTVCEPSANVPPEMPLAERMTRAIHQSYADPTLSLKTIANAEHRSARYFGRVFKKFVGLSFSQYLRAVRIEKGARLLLTSGHEVKTVASLSFPR